MPENPVTPLEDHFADNPTGYEQAQKSLHIGVNHGFNKLICRTL